MQIVIIQCATTARKAGERKSGFQIGAPPVRTGPKGPPELRLNLKFKSAKAKLASCAVDLKSVSQIPFFVKER